MKKLLTFILLCMIGVVAVDRSLGLLFDYLHSKIRTGQTGGKINHYINMRDTPSLVIMGNSRSLYQIIPDSLSQNSFNLSHAGMGPAFQLGLLNILSQQGKLPAAIVLHIEPEDFFGPHYNRDIQNLKHYYGKDSIVTDLINKISPHEKYKYLFKLYRYNGRAITLVKNLIQSSYLTIELKGYEIVRPAKNDSVNTLHSQKYEIAKDLTVNQTQLALLKDFMELCAKKKVKLICFTSPVYNSFNETSKYMNTMERYFKSHRIPYVSYVKNPIAGLQNNPRLWRDQFHLNHLGAQIESSALKRDLKSFGWSN